MKIKRALISVSDKSGLEDFVKGLHRMGVEIISTGGTCEKISSMGIPVAEVSSYTGFPEMMDGRVKTLHPKIHGGLLALRDNARHMEQAAEHDIPMIDMVVVNLYPFEETVSRHGVTLEEAIENIDIGGPSMLRSAAKNYRSVAVVSSPAQYGKVMKELEENGCGISEETSKQLALEVFKRTSLYDGAISRYLSGPSGKSGSGAENELPATLEIRLERARDLRYGENPHQKAALYGCEGEEGKGVIDAEQIQGKELSFNNIIDIDSAFEMVASFEEPTVSIVKHNNPCGIASASTLKRAYLDALECDRLSAFGSIMGFNGKIGKEFADTILAEADFIECVIAPEYAPEALEAFKAKKNIRILKKSLPEYPPRMRDMKRVRGGFLVQDKDFASVSAGELKTVTKEKPSGAVMASLLFAWKAVSFVKSNAIVLCQGTRSVGIGAGQMSRVDSVIIAVRKAGKRAKGAVLASDAFFPMADSIEEAHKAGIAAIIQPGGSIRDREVIDACDKFGIPMVFTGKRHFRH